MTERTALRIAVAIGATVLICLYLWFDSWSLAGRTELRIKSLLALLSVLVLFLARLPAVRRSGRRAAALYGLVALFGVAAFFNFGDVRHRNIRSFIHYWEHFHYQLGSKYFPELGYDGLYVASLAAERESAPGRVEQETIRDLRSNRLTPVALLGAHRDEVVARFAPERWRSFVADHHHYLEVCEPPMIAAIRRDHGYNPPPTWTFVARLFDARLPAGTGTLALLAALDVVLIGMAFAAVFRTYGTRVGCLGLVVFGLGYGWRYHYVGAFLRLDWLAAALTGICMLRRERPALAGALLGYAASVRLFPALLLAGPGAVALRALLRGERPRWALRLGAGFAVVVVLGLFAGSATGRGVRVWREFADNIELHRKSWPPTRVGLDVLVLNGPHLVEGALAEWSASRSLPRGPRKLQSLLQRDVERLREERWWTGALLKAGLLFLLGAALWRATPAESAVLAMASVFALIPIESYYWVMLLALPLRGGTAATAGFLALSAALYGVDLFHPGMVTRYALMSLGLALILLGWILPDALRTLRQVSG